MTSIASPLTTRARPSWLHLVAIQVALIARSGRWIELVGGAIALYVLAVFGPVISSAREIAHTEAAWGQWALYCEVLVAIWPALLWHREPLGRRNYHWSLPVPRGAHDLARIAAGAVWVLVLLGVIAGARYVSLWPLGRTDAGDMSEIVSYGVGLVTLYCVASVVTLISARPGRWFFGVLTVYLLLWTPLSVTTAPSWMFRAWGQPIVGRYGLFWATIGAGSSGDPTHEETAHTITTSPGDNFIVTVKISDSTSTTSTEEQLVFPGPHWRWGASAVWLAGSIAAMLLIAARRRERR
jgi:hypothetical protein